MSLWRPFPPGAQALVPPGFLATRCERCGRGTVDAHGGMDVLALRQANLAVHRWLHADGRYSPILIDPPLRHLVLNVAAALDTAARNASNPVARIRGIRQARSLRYPWLAWLWALLPERPVRW